MDEKGADFKRPFSVVWTGIKTLATVGVIGFGAYYVADALHNGSPTSGGNPSSTADADTTPPTLKVSYDQTPYCPPAGCMDNHVVRILNTGLQPIHIRSVLLNNRTGVPKCNLPVNETLQTGDHWEAKTGGFLVDTEDTCGTIVLVSVQTDAGNYDFQFGQ